MRREVDFAGGVLRPSQAPKEPQVMNANAPIRFLVGAVLSLLSVFALNLPATAIKKMKVGEGRDLIANSSDLRVRTEGPTLTLAMTRVLDFPPKGIHQPLGIAVAP